MQIGKKIKQLRLKKGLTQEELGERTDLSKGFISQLERDLNSPSIETLFSILNVLGCKPKDFFDDEHSRTKVVFEKEEQTVNVDEEKSIHCTGLSQNPMKMIWSQYLLFLIKAGNLKSSNRPYLKHSYMFYTVASS